jgi:predicted 3-demethylubiquinone-9 3-methyltransferase (glyoxalase superfamily)
MLADGEMPRSDHAELLFSNEVCGRAEGAVKFITGSVPGLRSRTDQRYREGEAASPDAKVNFAGFKLRGQDFAAIGQRLRRGLRLLARRSR